MAVAVTVILPIVINVNSRSDWKENLFTLVPEAFQAKIWEPTRHKVSSEKEEVADLPFYSPPPLWCAIHVYHGTRDMTGMGVSLFYLTDMPLDAFQHSSF